LSILLLFWCQRLSILICFGANFDPQSCAIGFVHRFQDERGYIVVQYDASRVEKEGNIMAFMNLYYKHHSITVAKYGLVRDRSERIQIQLLYNICCTHSTASRLHQSSLGGLSGRTRRAQVCL
jgi:hypothetical protein